MLAIVSKLGFWLLVLCTALAPIPFGSNSQQAAAFLGLVLGVPLILASLAPRPTVRAQRLIGVALVLALTVTGTAIIQVVYGEPGRWGHRIWEEAQPLIGNAASVISVSRLQPLHSAGYVLLPIGAFIVALIYVRTHALYMVFVQVLLVIGLVITLLCLAQYHLSPGMLLWEKKRYYEGSFTGTFVNPNTAATFYGILLLVSSSVCGRQIERMPLYPLLAGSRPWGMRDRARLSDFVFYATCTLTFAIALLLTRSRAGILSSIVGLGVFICVYAFMAIARRGSRGRAMMGSAAAFVGLGAFLFIFGERLMRRISLEGLIDEGRLCAYRSTWAALQDNFWWGTGLGTFQDIFPGYRSSECGFDGYWEMAHSVYLEAWLGLGVMFFACAALVYFPLLVSYFVGLRRRRRFRFVPLQGLCILIVLTLHSAVDFSLQIPGLAVVAASFLGAAASLALGETPRGRKTSTRGQVEPSQRADLDRGRQAIRG